MLDGGSGDVDDPAARRKSPTTSQSHGGALLEFLYPEKTLALLKTLSVAGYDASEPRRQPLQRPSIRRFSTAQRQPLHETSGLDPAVAVQADEEMASLLKETPDVYTVLSLFLDRKEPGKQELAWLLYTAMNNDWSDDATSATTKRRVLNYLTADEDLVPNRILQVFDELPEDERHPSSYKAAILAYLSLRMMGPAIQLLERISPERDFKSLAIAAGAILRRTILDEQWDLGLRVFRLFLDRKSTINSNPIPTIIRRGQTVPWLWEGAKDLPTLQDHVESFLTHVGEFNYELKSSEEKKEALSLFTTSLIPYLVDQILKNQELDESAMATTISQLFKKLRNHKLATLACYEHTIKRLIVIQRHRAASDLPGLCSSMYERYRKLCLEPQENQPKPSLRLLRHLLVYYDGLDDIQRVQQVADDMHTFFPDRTFAPGLLRILISRYAEFGDAARVHRYFDELLTHHRQHLDLKIISGLLFVYARRADVAGTIAQFRRVRDEFGLTPDTVCWNILLLAYVRADDLDGALGCFNSCIDNGVEPDSHTFGTLLDFCAQRGDVEAFEALFSRAQLMGVPLMQEVRARSGYVEAFLNAGDPQGAEAIAKGMLKNWQSGTLRGNALTYTWNLLIQHHALQGDLAGARQRYRDMIDHNIPLDTWTYAGLIRALVAVKQTNAAYTLLRRTMPQNHMRAHALHYAIIMTGFLREGGGQLQKAQHAYGHMVKAGIFQTTSSQEATIRTLGALDLKDLKAVRNKPRKFRLDRVEDALEEMVAEAVQGQAGHRQPRHARAVESRNYGSAVQGHYGLLISLYAQRGAYETCKKLFEKAEAAAPDDGNYIVPMTLLTGMMEAHLKAGEHAEVFKCWELARDSAAKLTKTFDQAFQPASTTPDFDSITHPSVAERFEQSRIAPNRRQILYKAARLYMRSLFDPTNTSPDPLRDAQRTMRDLLVNGYILDTFTWNEFVATLAQRGRFIDAFSICELYLMHGFPGWRNLHPNYIRKDRKGYQWMELRHYEITASILRPRYKTIILLANAFRQVRIDERNGIGYNDVEGKWMRQILEENASMTIRAIETMPRTGDKLQMEFLQ